MLKGGATALKDKITAFERRIEMLFFLTKQRKSSIVELAENYSVCRKTAYNDIMFLSRYAPIYTKGGVNGGVFLMDDYRNSMFLYLRIFEDAGFKLKELIIKEQHNCKATGYWKTNSVKYNFLLIAHEYLFVFRK